MDTHSYLLFDLENTRYGIRADVVREVFFLPFVTPIAEAPRDIVGVFNLRGEIVPVMDLNRRLEHRSRDYQLSDCIIAIAEGDIHIAVIVHQVREVVSVSEADLTTDLSYGRDRGHRQRFVRGVAQVGSDLVALLDERALIRDAEEIEALDNEDVHSDTPDNGDREMPGFCPNASFEELEIFRQRANSLRIPAESQDLQNVISLAVVSIRNEYFGIDLQTVREFTEIRNVTPVPCCPPHVVGNMNLRGEILTLVTIDGLLNLSSAEKPPERAVVVQVDDIVAGIAVDEVYDVTHANPAKVSAIPTAVRAQGDEYLRGTVLYKHTALTILDVRKLLEQGELIVDEEPLVRDRL